MLKRLKPYLRIAGFLLCLALLIAFANTHLLQTDTVPFINMEEMKAREDIELAIVGSSVVRDHFNPEIISEMTGLTAFDAAIPCAALQGDIAMTEQMFKTSSPKYVAAVLEPYALNTAKEDFETMYKLMPSLEDPGIMLRYYLRTCKEDGKYLDRLLLFRTQMAESLDDLVKTFSLRYDTEAAYARISKTFDPSVTYEGAGFLRYHTQETADTLIRRQMIGREKTGWTYPLLPATQEMLLEYRALCEANGAQLIIVVYPMHTSHGLARDEFLPYTDSLTAFCAEQGIPCFNLSYAKPELMPRLDAYYFDLDHMNETGADILSAAFAQVFNRYAAGEDVSGLFYPDRTEYLKSIDYISNCWLRPRQDGTYEADCNRGSLVEPQYRFVLRDADGEETLLCDYSDQAVIAAQIPEGANLRVYARVQGQAQDEGIYFDYPDDYNPKYFQ